jgi:hypothetical protein
MSIKQFSGKIYPDKSFSLGAVPPPKKSAQDRIYDREHASQLDFALDDKISWLLGNTSIGGIFKSTSENPLFIKSLKSSQLSRGAYGKHGITGLGKRCVKNTCILLESKFHRSQLGFATATLPFYSDALLHRINGAWGEIVRRFFQKIRRLFAKRGSKFIYVSVTEIQEKRFKRYSQPCPHLHFVYFARRNPQEGYVLQTSDFVTAWRNTLGEVINIISNDCMDALKSDCMDALNNDKGSVKLESIRVSAASYLGKYMTKGCKVVVSMQEKGWNQFPKQWWSVCNYCRKLFKDSIIHLSSKECQALYYGFEHYLHEGSLTWAMLTYYTSEGKDYVCGLVGTMSNHMYKLFSG